MANSSLMKVERAPLGVFCNTFDLHFAIIGLEKKTQVGLPFEWSLKTDFTVLFSLPLTQLEQFYVTDVSMCSTSKPFKHMPAQKECCMVNNCLKGDSNPYNKYVVSERTL